MAATPLPSHLRNLSAKEAEAENTTARSDTHAVSTVFAQATVDTAATGGSEPTVTTPSVPTSTTPVTNSTGMSVVVDIKGGTVTVVAINGVTVGTGDGTYLLPNGGTIAITYSGAPTWVWQALTGLPDAPAGFVEVAIGGNLCKVPFYNA